MSDFKVDNAKERLLCYAAGLLGARLSNPNHTGMVTEWNIKFAIIDATRLINSIYDNEKLKEILKPKEEK